MWGQAKIVLPSLILSILMAAGSYSVTLADACYGLQLSLGILVGIVLYLGLARLFRLDAMILLMNMARSKMKGL
jgi:hypothetical protein